ncbi:cyclic lactone autoinducer peptide [Clostridiaceae bacterium M8S5]|nr:cyclic lactone autoinducer peptide [Clostridiaceae bacterium M8S5]
MKKGLLAKLGLTVGSLAVNSVSLIHGEQKVCPKELCK